MKGLSNYITEKLHLKSGVKRYEDILYLIFYTLADRPSEEFWTVFKLYENVIKYIDSKDIEFVVGYEVPEQIYYSEIKGKYLPSERRDVINLEMYCAKQMFKKMEIK